MTTIPLSLITSNSDKNELPKSVIRALGVDLGTTNSVVVEALFDPENGDIEIKPLEIEQPSRLGNSTSHLVPSVVACYDGQIWVGSGAKELRSQLTRFDLKENKNIFWGCKNFMGVRRTYHQADVNFRTAKDIAGHVLKFLYDASVKKQNGTVSKTVITVPASFQPAQKQDTLDAASIAGITLDDGCLLDEPIAALLGYLSFQKKRIFDETDTPKNLLVFDFGGGTCDIAIFKLLNSKSAQPVSISPLSVSRYLRLGGGDIDNAIVLKLLLPQLLKQNGLNEFDLNYQQKKDYVIPSLLGVAESLKIAISSEIYRLKQFDGLWDEKRETLYHELPSAYSCNMPKYSELVLKNPRLSAIEFEEILKPFTDVDILYPIQDEYSITSSIFSPIQDALERCNLGPEEIDFCLLAGGSSLIPQIEEVLNQYFTKGSLLRFNDSDQLQTSVAVGASLQALSLSIFNRRLVQPVSSDDISIRTKSGSVNLVQRGTPLPYPSDGSWASNESLRTPQSEILRVELENSRQEILLQDSWKITPSVNKGKPLLLKYRVDGNLTTGHT